MAQQEIKITSKDGKQFDSYLTTPSGGQPGAGVVIISTILGVDEDMRRLADDLAGRGYAVSVPDPFWRSDPGVVDTDEKGWGRAFARMNAAVMDQDIEDLSCTMEDLRNRPECNGKVAVMGFCFGGPVAFCAATRLGAAAAVGFHGSPMSQYLGEIGNVKGPLCFNWGDNDEVTPMDEIAKCQEAFKGVKDAEIHVFPGANHGYMQKRAGMEGRHDPKAAEQSWKNALAALAKV